MALPRHSLPQGGGLPSATATPRADSGAVAEDAHPWGARGFLCSLERAYQDQRSVHGIVDFELVTGVHNGNDNAGPIVAAAGQGTSVAKFIEGDETDKGSIDTHTDRIRRRNG